MTNADDLVDTVTGVLGFFQGDEAKTKLWFATPNPQLGGIEPIVMIQWGRFHKLANFVREALAANERGDRL